MPPIRENIMIITTYKLLICEKITQMRKIILKKYGTLGWLDYLNVHLSTQNQFSKLCWTKTPKMSNIKTNDLRNGIY